MEKLTAIPVLIAKYNVLESPAKGAGIKGEGAHNFNWKCCRRRADATA